MREADRRRINRFLKIVAAGALVGALFGAAIGQTYQQTALTTFLIGPFIGVIHGGIISAFISGVELFFPRTAWGRALRRAAFSVTLLIKAPVYILLVLGIEYFRVGEQVAAAFGLIQAVEPMNLSDPMTVLSIVFSIFFIIIFIQTMQINQIMGHGTLFRFVFGYYHRPRLENRFFLFIDLIGSTHLAETLGALTYQRFLNGVFQAASDPISDHQGEIYQYVGDQMVVTWTEAAGTNGRKGAVRPLDCVFALKQTLADLAPAYLKEYREAPAIRAALHYGEVVVGEIGDAKRDIAFHGDVLNATARLEGVAREYQGFFITSAVALDRLSGAGGWPSGYDYRRLGPLPLRGKSAPVEAVLVTQAAFGQ
jgi:adenylate cyclase